MFFKGTMKDDGIDITLKNNPDHILSPDDWDMVLNVKFNKIPFEKYKTYYLNLLRDRWSKRQPEFMELAREGISKDIYLKCFCPSSTDHCHAVLASNFMNALVEKIKKQKVTK